MHLVKWSSEAGSHYFRRQEWSQDDNINANGNGKTESFFSRFTQKLNKGFLPKYIHHRELTFLSQDYSLVV